MLSFQELWTQEHWFEQARHGKLPWPAAKRPRLMDARRAVLGIREPAEAWEELHAAAILPDLWVHHPTRRFHLRAQAGDRISSRTAQQDPDLIAISSHSGVPKAPCLRTPITVEDVILIASDAAAIEEAERLAFVAAARFAALGQGTFTLAHLAEKNQLFPPRFAVWSTREAHDDLRSLRLLVHKLSVDLGPRRPASLAAHFTRHYSEWTQDECEIVGHCLWFTALEEKRLLSPTDPAPGSRFYTNPSAAGLPYRRLENPFSTLLSLRELGYSLRAISPEAVVLVASRE